MNACFCCVRFSFFHTKPRGWPRETSPKWLILYGVGCKTTTRSINQQCGLLCAGVEPHQLQAEDEPLWSHWIRQHRNCLPRRLSVCFWWKSKWSRYFGFRALLTCGTCEIKYGVVKALLVTDGYLHVFVSYLFIRLVAEWLWFVNCGKVRVPRFSWIVPNLNKFCTVHATRPWLYHVVLTEVWWHCCVLNCLSFKSLFHLWNLYFLCFCIPEQDACKKISHCIKKCRWSWKYLNC